MTADKRIIAVGGGKGGVGKSLVAANLGMALARAGRRVIMLDADLGGANLHTCLGVESPARTLSHFINRSVEDLNQLVVPTGLWSLGLISGARDNLEAANPYHQQKMRLLRHLSKLDCEDLIIDLGAGTSYNVLDFYLFAQHGLLVVTPEPTSEENAFRFLKAAYLRLLRSVQRVYGLKALLEDAVAEFTARGFTTPRELVATVRGLDPEAGRVIEDEMQRFRPNLVVNQYRDLDDKRMGERIRHTTWRMLGIELNVLGAIPHDDTVWQVLRRGRPLLVDTPDSAVARAIDGLATTLGTGQGKGGIKAALQRGLRLFVGDAPEPDEAPEVHDAPVTAAALPPQPTAPPPASATPVSSSPPAPPKPAARGPARAVSLPPVVASSPTGAASPTAAEGYDGAALRAVRSARGWSIADLAERTKIPRDKLAAIEDNNYAAFPARVYLRGFVLQFARQLGLDADRVTIDYLKLYDSWADRPAS